MLQWFDPRSFLFCPQLSVRSFLALFLKILRNRLSCHACQCGRTGAVKSVSFWPLTESDGDFCASNDRGIPHVGMGTDSTAGSTLPLPNRLITAIDLGLWPRTDAAERHQNLHSLGSAERVQLFAPERGQARFFKRITRYRVVGLRRLAAPLATPWREQWRQSLCLRHSTRQLTLHESAASVPAFR